MKRIMTIYLLLLSHLIFAQIDIKSSIDFGIVTSGFTSTRERDKPAISQTLVNKTIPLISPTFGINVRLLHTGFFIECGSQYSKIGNSENHYRIENGKNIKSYNYLSIHKQEFSRVSIPFVLGYSYKLSPSLNLEVSAGAKYNFLVNAKEVASYDNNSVKGQAIFVITSNRNPLSSEDFSDVIQNRNISTIMGIGIMYKNRFGMNLNYSINPGLSYGNSFGFEGYYEYWKKNDLSFTIKYYLF